MTESRVASRYNAIRLLEVPRLLVRSRLLRTAVFTFAVLVMLGFFSWDRAWGAGDASTEDIRAGEYLAAAGNCFSCHTARGGKAFAGGVPFYTDFGTIYSSNITSSKTSGIGAWTEQDFTRAMRTGVGKSGEHLYPAFPYTAFTKLSDVDLHRIFVYLRGVVAVNSTPPANEMKFPLNLRASLAGWKLMYFKEGRFQNSIAMNAQQNRGAYLVEALGHCSACHSPRNILGAERASGYLQGGIVYDVARDGEIKVWSTANLTPAAGGLKDWSLDDITKYLTTGYSPRAVAFGPMNEVVANSTRFLTTEDATAVAAYLKSLPIEEAHEAPIPDVAAHKAGENLYTANCGSCHQPNGEGSAKTAPPLRGSAIVLAQEPASMLNAILYSPELSEVLQGDVSRPSMPAFEAKLDNEEIAQLATYVRNTWGNHAGAVTPEQVQAQR